MLVFLLLAIVALIGFGIFVLAANVGGRGMLMLSLVILLIGFAITLLSISALGDAEAAAPVVHHQSLYSVKHDAEKPFNWGTFVNDPYFEVFAGIVVVLWGVAGCVGYGLSKDKTEN